MGKDPQLKTIEQASEQPISNVQPIKMQQIIPQQTNQDQHNSSTQLLTMEDDPMKGQAAQTLMNKLRKRRRLVIQKIRMGEKL